MSGYPGLIGEWMSGEIAEGCPRAGQRVTGKVVGGSECHPQGHLALLIDGEREVVYVGGMGLRVEKRPPLPRPEPTGLPSRGSSRG